MDYRFYPRYFLRKKSGLPSTIIEIKTPLDQKFKGHSEMIDQK